MHISPSLTFKIALVVLFVVLSFFLAGIAEGNGELRAFVSQFGYLGIFLFSIFSGFNVIIPIPAVALIPLFIESGFSFLPLIVVISVGLTVGDLLGYLIGNIGRDIARKKQYHPKLFEKLWELQERFPKAGYPLLLVYVALVPGPNELVVIPLSFMGYRLVYVAPILVIGNLIFNFLYGYVGVTVFEFL